MCDHAAVQCCLTVCGGSIGCLQSCPVCLGLHTVVCGICLRPVSCSRCCVFRLPRALHPAPYVLWPAPPPSVPVLRAPRPAPRTLSALAGASTQRACRVAGRTSTRLSVSPPRTSSTAGWCQRWTTASTRSAPRMVSLTLTETCCLRTQGWGCGYGGGDVGGDWRHQATDPPEQSRLVLLVLRDFLVSFLVRKYLWNNEKHIFFHDY